MKTPLPELEGARVTVMGLGRFGGGLGVTRWLVGRGAQVLVTDLASEDDLREPLGELEPLVSDGSVTLRLGSHNVSHFTSADLVVANPAVPKPWDNRFLRSAEAAGVPVTTEIGLCVSSLPGGVRTIGVTGSAGKSTTVSMVAAGLAAAGADHLLGGNLGGSLLGRAEAMHPGSVLVLELSSAMLHWLDDWSPDVAVVTGFAPNHIDWHGSMEHYLACKQKLLSSQARGSTAVLGAGVADWPTREGVERVVDPEPVSGLTAIGKHNEVNAGLAMAALRAVDVEERAALAGIRGFPGLPHRLQSLGERGGVLCVNDSKSTTPEATRLACEAVAPLALVRGGRVLLIAGGYDKGVDLSGLAGLAGEPLVFAIGATASAVATATDGTECGTLDVAVQRAMARAGAGDVLLLSPACASWDQFSHFEARGQAFDELTAQAAAAGANR